jgi:acyl carrier protein
LVDPETGRVVDEGVVGEIWLRGDGLSRGYWNRDQENTDRFDAQLADGRSGYCRTGDLGFTHQGHLFITGRIKDVIILRGRNLFPQDVESTVRQTMGADAGQCAAFAVDGPRGECLAILAEIPRRADASTLPESARNIRRTIIEVHDVDPRHVLLVRQATVPLTSSGKIQRNRCREMFAANELETKYRYDRNGGGEESPLPMPAFPKHPRPGDRQEITQIIGNWMTDWLVARAGVDPANIDHQRPFSDYGLDSMTGVELCSDIEDWSDIAVTPLDAWNHPTVADMSAYIAEKIVSDRQSRGEPSEVARPNLSDRTDANPQLPEGARNPASAEKHSS